MSGRGKPTGNVRIRSMTEGEWSYEDESIIGSQWVVRIKTTNEDRCGTVGTLEIDWPESAANDVVNAKVTLLPAEWAAMPGFLRYLADTIEGVEGEGSQWIVVHDGEGWAAGPFDDHRMASLYEELVQANNSDAATQLLELECGDTALDDVVDITAERNRP